MSLSATIRHQRGSLSLELDIEVGDEIVAVLGPNGAGKTSLLRLLAGLDSIDHGRITLDNVVMDDPDGGHFVRPERRAVGVVFQEYLLFPFLSARDNIAFGLRAAGIGRPRARGVADEWLRRFGLAAFGDAKPDALSGGQAQRVALARALATAPTLLLLDEPLAALDVSAKGDIRRELRSHLSTVDGPRLIVTHDPIDAASLADRVLILEAGRVTQVGTMAEIAFHPRSPYIAELVGINFYRGDARDGQVTLPSGAVIVIAERAVRGEVGMVIHPRSITVLLSEPTGSARNHWRGRVSDVDFLGERVRVRIDAALPLVAEITATSAAELGLKPGLEVVATAKATEISTYTL